MEDIAMTHNYSTFDRRKIIKRSYQEMREVNLNQRKLELNFYVQKKMIDYPENYIEEIRKDIRVFEDFLLV